MIFPTKNIKDLKPYQNGFHSHDVFEQGIRLIKLDSNESTIAPSPRVIAALTEFIKEGALNWYPDVHATALIEALSEYTGIDRKFIQTFNGSDNALEVICRTFLSQNDTVLMDTPTYDHFRVYAQAQGASLVTIRADNPFKSKFELILDAAKKQNPRLVYLVNPNNPTGVLHTEAQIKELLDCIPNTLVIVDEAYFEFSGKTVQNLLKDHDNLIVTRSFSKAFALAGLRCGYILADTTLIEPINKVRIGKNINMLAQVAAISALEDQAYMTRYVSEVKNAKAWTLEKMKSLNLQVIDTPANYIMVKLHDPDQVVSLLSENQIFVRNRNTVDQLQGYIRLTIGHLHLMERFWKVFKDLPTELLTGECDTNLTEKVQG